MIITVYSWNVRSIANSHARHRVLSYLSYLTTTTSASHTIFLLQEHQLDAEAVLELESTTPYHIFFTQHLLTLVPTSLSPSLDSEPTSLSPTDGRTLTVYFSLREAPPLELVNVYAPPQDALRLPFFTAFDFAH